jgi:class 3 adenylate cyclase
MKIRVGIATGQGVGFLTGGHSKLKYELMGEVVERAEKVQESAEPGGILVDSVTRDWVLKKGFVGNGTRKGEERVVRRIGEEEEKQGERQIEFDDVGKVVGGDKCYAIAGI